MRLEHVSHLGYLYRWGKPIDVILFVDECLSEPAVDSRNVIKKLTREIEKSLVAMTINAPNWFVSSQVNIVLEHHGPIHVRDTLYQAQVARNIVWKDEAKIPAKDYVPVTQRYVSNRSTRASLH